MLENHRVKTIPRIGSIRTETVRAYADSRGHRDLKKAFVELYEIRYDEQRALPTDVVRCEAEADAYLAGKSGIPAYILKALEIIRLWQVQIRTRV